MCPDDDSERTLGSLKWAAGRKDYKDGLFEWNIKSLNKLDVTRRADRPSISMGEISIPEKRQQLQGLDRRETVRTVGAREREERERENDRGGGGKMSTRRFPATTSASHLLHGSIRRHISRGTDRFIRPVCQGVPPPGIPSPLVSMAHEPGHEATATVTASNCTDPVECMAIDFNDLCSSEST